MMQQPTFRTDSLPLAAYLMASDLLSFLGCEQTRLGHVEFMFLDPEAKGKEFADSFRRGARCPAVGFYYAMKAVRRATKDALSRPIQEESTK